MKNPAFLFTYLETAFLEYPAFYACWKFNKLHVFNTAETFNSHRLTIISCSFSTTSIPYTSHVQYVCVPLRRVLALSPSCEAHARSRASNERASSLSATNRGSLCYLLFLSGAVLTKLLDRALISQLSLNLFQRGNREND
jgi:hypothetical protein